MMKGFYYDEKARKRPPVASLKDLIRKAEMGTITEDEAARLDSMRQRINMQSEGRDD